MNILFKNPSNTRDWSEDQKVLATANFNNNLVEVLNIRNFQYRSRFDYTPNYYNQTFNTDLLNEVWLGLVPFSWYKPMAHILIVFKFSDSKELVLSVEIRKPKGKSFSAWKTSLSLYEIMYVIADPNDVIELRTKHRENEPVNLHLLNLDNEQRIKLFTNILTRANKLASEPEFFNLIYNSCGSNVVDHLNEILETKIFWVYKYLAPGHLLESSAVQKILKT